MEFRIDFIPKLVVKASERREVGFVIFGALSHVWLLWFSKPKMVTGGQMEKKTQTDAVVLYYSNMHGMY